ncbi:hypothetical protein [Cupriavidus basilensis]|uniref:hypothetical protein n=1 Tax=Cupriavidus basilensis TaxID=68895 RepID=UPI001268687E|nr:hypothetical protein [Cupriavidus basilensis]MDF3886173.1 hypothetical protein [Cupriavidus basilensis]
MGIFSQEFRPALCRAFFVQAARFVTASGRIPPSLAGMAALFFAKCLNPILKSFNCFQGVAHIQCE